MDHTMEKANLQVTFPKEKLEALAFYMQEKELTVESELQNYMTSIYEKYVPAPTRRYLSRNDTKEEQKEEKEVSSSKNVPSNEERNTKNIVKREKKRAEKEQKEAEQSSVTETFEEITEQSEEESQGMVMTM